MMNSISFRLRRRLTSGFAAGGTYTLNPGASFGGGAVRWIRGIESNQITQTANRINPIQANAVRTIERIRETAAGN